MKGSIVLNPKETQFFFLLSDAHVLPSWTVLFLEEVFMFLRPFAADLTRELPRERTVPRRIRDAILNREINEMTALKRFFHFFCYFSML